MIQAPFSWPNLAFLTSFEVPSPNVAKLWARDFIYNSLRPTQLIHYRLMIETTETFIAPVLSRTHKALTECLITSFQWVLHRWTANVSTVKAPSHTHYVSFWFNYHNKEFVLFNSNFKLSQFVCFTNTVTRGFHQHPWLERWLRDGSGVKSPTALAEDQSLASRSQAHSDL